jgi:hypothetical protein
VTSDLLGNYFHDLEFQRCFQNWLNSLWTEKEQLLTSMMDAR